MGDHPKSTSLVAPVVIAGALLVVSFGGGVLVGWATRPRMPTVTKKSEEVVFEQEVRRELDECRAELRALAKAQVNPPARVTVPGEAEDAGPATVAKVEALQREVHECKKHETLIKAHVCAIADEHINVQFVLVYSSSCEDKAQVGEYMIKSYEKCAEFEYFDLDETPEHFDLDNFDKEEQRKVWEAGYDRKYFSKKTLTGWSDHTLRECRKRFGLPAPEK